MLESRELTKKFGAKTAVDQVSVSMEPGHIYAMLGPNGSGKTTWMKMAAGLIKPTSGEVFFAGQPVGIASRKEVAYMSTEPYFYAWMSIEDAGKYYADFFEDFSMEHFLNMLHTMDLNEKDKIRNLSSGMVAKMKIALTLARDAKVYMLARDEIRSAILEAAAPGKLLLLSSHLVEEMEAIADRAVFIRKGKLVEVRDLEEMRETDGVSMADRYREIFGHGEVQA